MQSQRKEDQASQIRMERVLVEAVAVDGRKKWCFRFEWKRTCGQGQVPEVSDQHSVVVAWEADKVSRQRSDSIFRTRCYQEEVRTKCSGFHSQNCKKCVKQSRLHESDEKKQEVQRKPASEEGKCGEVDCKKKLDQRNTGLQKQLRDTK